MNCNRNGAKMLPSGIILFNWVREAKFYYTLIMKMRMPFGEVDTAPQKKHNMQKNYIRFKGIEIDFSILQNLE